LNIVDEINSGVHERHVYAGSMHVASNTTGMVEYYHVDHLGSTRLKTNSSGGIIYESNYEPFGVSSGEEGSEDYRYTGKHEDTTGLYYFGARYYEPVTGRFITRDTVMGKLFDPQPQNKYVYCLNNPHKYIDPDGEFAHIAVGAFIGASINMGMYTFTNILAGTDLHSDAFKTGLFASGVSGAISGGLSAAIGPATGTVTKLITGSASQCIEKTLITLAMQAASETLAYGAETFITGEKRTFTDAVISVGAGVGMSTLSENVIRPARGMSTLAQAKYFTPRKISTYAKAFFNHPDASRNAAAIMNTISLESLGAGLVSSIYTITSTSVSSSSPSSFDEYESRRF